MYNYYYVLWLTSYVMACYFCKGSPPAHAEELLDSKRVIKKRQTAGKSYVFTL